MTRLTDEQIDDIAGAVDAVTVLASSWERDRSFARAIEAELSKQAEPVAHGELHPDRARSVARTALGYAQAFDGKGTDWHSDDPWPHRSELAQALDWITDLGAMVLNLADRVTAPLPAAPDTVQVPRCEKCAELMAKSAEVVAQTHLAGLSGHSKGEVCIHRPDDPQGCYRVRCQLGKVCAAAHPPQS